jgi:hypothetical protein
MTWKLKRLRQCEKCPWKASTDPNEIPNGYQENLHRALACTIAEPGALRPLHDGDTMHWMACHESRPHNDTECVGWLMNQIGPGNNIPLRIRMMDCENIRHVQLDGEQHERFEDTLPRRKRARAAR